MYIRGLGAYPKKNGAPLYNVKYWTDFSKIWHIEVGSDVIVKKKFKILHICISGVWGRSQKKWGSFIECEVLDGF